MHNKKPLFITIEGIEGVGKSTCTKHIQLLLEKAKIPFIATREPGGTPIAESIRHVLLQQYDERMTYEAELLLMFASRIQHIKTVIQPALASGRWVLCDRFIDASYAYQGAGRGIPESHIAMLETWLAGNLQPDLTILLDAPVSVALKRAKHRSKPDRFESETIDFFTRAREAYLKRAQQFPKRFRVIDTSVPLDQVKTELHKVMNTFFM